MIISHGLVVSWLISVESPLKLNISFIAWRPLFSFKQESTEINRAIKTAEFRCRNFKYRMESWWIITA